MNVQNTAFIASLVHGAQEAHKLYGVPSSVTLAQAILESAWGKSGLTIEALNLFGIKADSSWHGEVAYKQTREVVRGHDTVVKAPFRKYASLADSILDHALFLKNNKRYASAFEYKGGCEFAKAIARAGYATDPKYADLLVALIKQHSLDQYDA